MTADDEDTRETLRERAQALRAALADEVDAPAEQDDHASSSRDRDDEA